MTQPALFFGFFGSLASGLLGGSGLCGCFFGGFLGCHIRRLLKQWGVVLFAKKIPTPTGELFASMEQALACSYSFEPTWFVIDSVLVESNASR
jgi:predicted lipid-binding transport protein (Tim44 family)